MIKRTTAIALTLVAVLWLSACSGKESGSDKTEASTSAPVKSAVTAADAPSQATKNFLEAVRNRRYAEIRSMLSARSIENLNQATGRAGTNIDQTLKRVVDQDAADMAANNVTVFETRNVEVRGDHASVEAKATNAPQYARLSLTKEGNTWKINIDETAPVEK